jgi:uncharacterized glyoxalase superfamily metalloenzyme YdcJ
MSKRVETWQLRAQFAAGLSRMYGAEVPAYTTLVEVSAEVNRHYVATRPDAERLGSLNRVTAERHGAIRVGSMRELADVAGTLRVRFGEVEARGVALTPQGRARYDAAMAEPDPSASWSRDFPATDEEMAAQGLAYYCGGDPSKPVVYEDFLPASAAGIFRSNIDTDTEAVAAVDDSDYSLDRMAGAIGHHIHDPYELYEKAAS